MGIATSQSYLWKPVLCLSRPGVSRMNSTPMFPWQNVMLMHRSPGGKTHRPFQEYRQYCSQHSRKLGQSFYLRCLSCFSPLSFWNQENSKGSNGTSQNSDTRSLEAFTFQSILSSVLFCFPICVSVLMRCVCVSSGDKVVIISNPASLISEVYWERPRTTNVPQIHVEAGWKFRILIKGAEDERKIVLVISGAMWSCMFGNWFIRSVSALWSHFLWGVLLISYGSQGKLFICPAQYKNATKSEHFHFDLNISGRLIYLMHYPMIPKT